MPARSASGTASEKGCRRVCPDSTIQIRRIYRSKLKDSKEGANLTTLARHVGQLSAQVPPGRNRARKRMEDAMQQRGRTSGSMARVTLLGAWLARLLVMLWLAVLVVSWGAPPTPAAPSGDRETVVNGWTQGEVISSGLYHTCAIKSDGTTTCWGLNGSGQTSAPTGTFTAISSGGSHTCALRSDGTAACWGDNTYGQATPPTGTFTAITTGGSHTCAIKSDGTAACWGSNRTGQTTLPAGLGTIISISAGALHTCAIKSDGTAVCWGLNTDGQSTPPATLGTLIAISSGGYQ